MRLFLVFNVILSRYLGECWAPHSRFPPTLIRIGTPNRNFRTILSVNRPSISEGTQREESFFFPWSDGTNEMKNQVEYMEHPHHENRQNRSSDLIGIGSAVGLVSVAAAVAMARSLEIRYVRPMDSDFPDSCVSLSIASFLGFSPSDIVHRIQEVALDPSAALDQVVQSVESMGSLGVIYFGIAYTIAEILAIPAIPLTASAGYLFGPVEGTSVVLLSASVAAAVSFVIGRTLLRDYVESALEDYPQFAKIDRAIGKEGFKLMLLLRLSPVFPFALSNYLYGASSINFSAFFFGTLFGFAPGTLAYVYTGYVGKALTDGGESSYPWFVYAGGLAVFAGLLKVVADTATKIVEELEEEDDTVI